MLLYRKDISQTGDEATSPHTEFRLIKFRSQHNHPLLLTKDRLRLETIAAAVPVPVQSSLINSCVKPLSSSG